MDSNQNRVRHLETKKRKIFIRKLPAEADENDLKTYFSKFGQIESVNLLRSFKTQQSRRLGHVVFKTQEEAENVFKQEEPHTILGEEIECEHCLLPEEIKKQNSKKGSIKTEALPLDLHSHLNNKSFMSFDEIKKKRQDFNHVFNNLFDVGANPITTGSNNLNSPDFRAEKTPNGGFFNFQGHINNTQNWGNMSPNKYPQQGQFYPQNGQNYQQGYSEESRINLNHQTQIFPNPNYQNGYPPHNQQYPSPHNQSHFFNPQQTGHQPQEYHQHHYQQQRYPQTQQEQFNYDINNHHNYPGKYPKSSFFSTESSSKTYEDHLIEEFKQEIEHKKHEELQFTSKQEMIIQLKNLKKERDEIDKKIRNLEEKIKEEDGVKEEEEIPDEGFLGRKFGIRGINNKNSQGKEKIFHEDKAYGYF